MTRVAVAVLGPLEVRVDDRPVLLTGPKQRIVLATLASDPNRVVSTERLVESLWGDDPPRSAEHAIQQHVSVIRKQFEAAGSPHPSSVVTTRAPGYVLAVGHSDMAEWDTARAQSRAAAGAGDWSAAIDALDHGLRLWRGAAFEDVDDSAFIDALRLRLGEQRIVALESRAEVLLAAGRPAEAVAELESLVAVHLLREAIWFNLMLGLYRCGRQADALAAYQSARAALVGELGIEPGARLRELETAILQQSPLLDLAREAPTARVEQREAALLATFQPGARELGRVVLPDGQRVLLWPGTSTIGRDPSVLVRLVDNRVSRQHASIEATEAGCLLRDLGSSNGTTVNGRPVGEHWLADGDVIGVGGVSLGFRGPEPIAAVTAG